MYSIPSISAACGPPRSWRNSFYQGCLISVKKELTKSNNVSEEGGLDDVYQNDITNRQRGTEQQYEFSTYQHGSHDRGLQCTQYQVLGLLADQHGADARACIKTA